MCQRKLLLSYLFLGLAIIKLSAQNWEVNTLFTGEGEYHYRGDALAIDGNIALVGGSSEAKSILVFEWQNETWTQIARLLPPDDSEIEEALFGTEIAIEDDLIVVSSSLWDGFTGRVYGYERPAGGWVDMIPTFEFKSSLGLPAGANFGASIAISNDVVVIGAPSTEGDESLAGHALLYEEPAGGWPVQVEETGILYPSNSAPYDWFGVEVAMDGDVLAVGSARGDESGTAYIFEKPTNGWSGAVTESATIRVTDGFVNDNFGRVLDLEGDVLVASIAIDNEATSNQNDNAIYVFEKGNSWADVSQTAKLTPQGIVGEDFGMGAEVEINQNRIYAGRWNGGSVLIFVRENGTWQDMNETAVLTYSGAADYQFFGRAIVAEGEHLVIGNRQNDLNTAGEVYFYRDTEFTSLDNIYQGQVRLFPNPSSGKINVDFLEVEVLELMIYNTLGQNVMHEEISARSAQIDLSSLIDGAYTLHFTLSDGQIAVRKLLIRN